MQGGGEEPGERPLPIPNIALSSSLELVLAAEKALPAEAWTSPLNPSLKGTTLSWRLAAFPEDRGPLAVPGTGLPFVELRQALPCPCVRLERL